MGANLFRTIANRHRHGVRIDTGWEMKLSAHEQKALAKSAKKKRQASIVNQIERHPWRSVGVSTAQARMKKWGWDIDKACTTPNMNFRG